MKPEPVCIERPQAPFKGNEHHQGEDQCDHRSDQDYLMKGVITTEKLDDTVLCRKTGHTANYAENSGHPGCRTDEFEWGPHYRFCCLEKFMRCNDVDNEGCSASLT